MAMDLDLSRWRTPLLVVGIAFGAGVQLPYVIQALAGGDYWANDQALKLFTIVLMAGGIYLLLPARATTPASPPAAPPRPIPLPVQRPAPPAAPPAPSTAEAPLLPLRHVKLTLETPLARGPVWPPGEPLPVTVQVRGAEDLPDVDVELELRHTQGVERVRTPLRGPLAVMSQTVPFPGPFTVVVRALRGGAALAEASVEGRAASYREEIARRFEQLKVASAQAGLPVGATSTPRDVRDALAQRYPPLRRGLEELVASLEIALYAEDEVGREAYEGLVRGLAKIRQAGLEAAPRA